MATDLIPNSLQARNTRMAISPRFATSTDLIGLYSTLVEYDFWLSDDDHRRILDRCKMPKVERRQKDILMLLSLQWNDVVLLLRC